MSDDSYRWVSKVYERFVDPLNNSLQAIGLKMFPPANGMAVLDVGCGTGTHLERYAAAGCRAFGIDVSPSMLERAKSRLGDQAELHLADASDLPFGDGTMDLVVVAMLIHELDEPTGTACLDEVARVVKPDGRVLAIDFRPGRLRFPKGRMLRGVSTLMELAAGRTHHRNFRRFMSAGGIPGVVGGRFDIEEEKPVAGGNVSLTLMKHPVS